MEEGMPGNATAQVVIIHEAEPEGTDLSAPEFCRRL
jgi:hypothetical protein